MRAAVVREPGVITSRPLVIEDRGPLAAAAGDLVLRVSACAVCRTDLQIAEGDLAARRLPIVPGHQVTGTVVAVGEGVEGWAPGDRAGLAWLGSACGACPRCMAGNENLCGDARFTGWDRDGGFAEEVACDARFAHRLPDGFSDIAAAPLLCGGVIGYRSLRITGVRPGGRLGLYGFGASAFVTLQVARHWGCEVFVATRSEREQRRALAGGAVWAGGYGDRPPASLDAAITFAPSGDVVVQALKAVDRGGTVAINAIHLDRIPEFSYDDLWWERSLRSVANFTRQDADEFLSLAATIPIRTEVATFPLEAVNEALASLRAGHIAGTAVLTM